MASGRHSDRAQVKQLLEAAKAYTHERWLRFYDRAMARAEAMLEDPDLTPKELQAVVTTGAIANDTYRLETGEATSRYEQATMHIYVPA